MKTANNLSVRKAITKGFSLVEMLVVIAIIGVIAAIAVPNISSLTESANTSKDKRNAQNLASVCASAQAAGLDFTKADNDPKGDPRADVDAVVTAIIAGDTVEGGSFAGDFFGVPNMDDKAGAIPYLSLENGVLKYSSTAAVAD